MVILHVKHSDKSLFLISAPLSTSTAEVIRDSAKIQNGRLKVQRICQEMTELAAHGVSVAPHMEGLLEEQISELRLSDTIGDACEPSGGSVVRKDSIGRRTGNAPNDDMHDVLERAVAEAKARVSRDNVKANTCLVQSVITETLSLLRGAVTIVYPMGLPEYDPVRMELENREDLEGTQASKDVFDPNLSILWFAGKEMAADKPLSEYLGKNEKTKVIVKLSKKGSGPPVREPRLSEEEQKEVMMHQYRKQEQLRQLEKDRQNDYLNSEWADSGRLQKSLHGVQNVSWRPK